MNELHASRSASRQPRGTEPSMQKATRQGFSTWERARWVPPPLEDPAFSTVVVAWLSAAGAPLELDCYRQDGE